MMTSQTSASYDAVASSITIADPHPFPLVSTLSDDLESKLPEDLRSKIRNHTVIVDRDYKGNDDQDRDANGKLRVGRTEEELEILTEDQMRFWATLHFLRIVPHYRDMVDDFEEQFREAYNILPPEENGDNIYLNRVAAKFMRKVLVLVWFEGEPEALPKDSAGEWCCVVFYSRRKRDEDDKTLFDLDKDAHEEAVAENKQGKGTLLVYKYGKATKGMRNFSTCDWLGQKGAKDASKLPKHAQAKSYADRQDVYEYYYIAYYRIVKQKGKPGLFIGPYPTGSKPDPKTMDRELEPIFNDIRKAQQQ